MQYIEWMQLHPVATWLGLFAILAVVWLVFYLWYLADTKGHGA